MAGTPEPDGTTSTATAFDRFEKVHRSFRRVVEAVMPDGFGSSSRRRSAGLVRYRPQDIRRQSRAAQDLHD